MATAETTVRARVSPDVKRKSEKILKGLGLSTTEAIRLFLFQVTLRNGLPFPLTLPYEDVEDIVMPAHKRREALDLIDGD